jgi:hypothetical protein
VTDLIASAPPKTEEVDVDFPSERELPEVSLGAFKISEAIEQTIVHGPTEANADRSKACASVYVALDHAGASLAEIISVVWNPEHGISERWHEPGRGYGALCLDVARVLNKVTT